MILRRVLRITTTTTTRTTTTTTTTISHFTKPFLVLPISRTYKPCISSHQLNQLTIHSKFHPTFFNTNILANKRFFSTSNKGEEGGKSEDQKKNESEHAQGLDVDTETPSDFVLKNKEKVRTDFSTTEDGVPVVQQEGIPTGSDQTLSFDDGGTMTRLESQLYGSLFLGLGLLLSSAFLFWCFTSESMIFDYNAMMSQAIELVAPTTVNLPAIKNKLGPVTVDPTLISVFSSENYYILLYPLILEKKNARGGTVYIDLIKRNGLWRIGCVTIDLVNGYHATLPKFEEFFWENNKFTGVKEILKEAENRGKEGQTLELSQAPPPTETEELKPVEKKKSYRWF